MRVVSGVKTARERIVARKDEDREDFLRKRGFSKAESAKIVATVLGEEGRPPESIYDFVQGITAFARTKTHQDSRLDIESKARKLLEAVHLHSAPPDAIVRRPIFRRRKTMAAARHTLLETMQTHMSTTPLEIGRAPCGES